MKKQSLKLVNCFIKKLGTAGHFKMRSGETLVEVVMAIFVVAIGATASANLIVSALQANSFSRDNLIALNLAVEGLEAMRNIRDTNWLKFGSDKEHCWNMRPEAAVCDLDVNKLIQRGSYTVDLNPLTMKWSLSDPMVLLDLNNPSSAKYLLNYVDLNNGGDSRDLYVSADAIAKNNITAGPESKFYRMIEVYYEADTDGDVSPEKSQEMNVTSLVVWKDGSVVHKVDLKTKLSNYQKPKPQS